MKCESGEKSAAEAEPGCRAPFVAVINTAKVVPANATNRTMVFQDRRRSPDLYDGLPRPSPIESTPSEYIEVESTALEGHRTNSSNPETIMLRLGAVSYLNTKPLIETLPGRLGRSGELRLDLPSRLARDLAAGELDIALIPSVEYFRGGDEYEMISDAAIACRGPVWSVRVLSRVPMNEVRTLALDEGSRTSAAMSQVLLAEMHGLRPKTVPFPIGSSPDEIDADALLVIGDRAMHPAPGKYQEIWDLGDRWCRWTELPFVFAMWVARRSAVADPQIRQQIEDALNVSRDEGLQQFETIAKREAAGHELTIEDLHRYFAENLHFQLGNGERSGLAAFREKAEHLGLVPASHSPLQD